MKMNTRAKNSIREKTRTVYGLMHILKDDIDNLRIDVANLDINRLRVSIADTNETLEKIIDIMAEIEYIIYLENLKGSH